jgi:RES domain-containing protein
VYTALEVHTVDMELARSVQQAGLAASSIAPRRLATIRVRLSRVLDLTSPRVRTELGVPDADLTADDTGLTRAIGEAAHHLGYEGVLAPSATGSGLVLAIFLDTRAPTSMLEVADIQEGYVPVIP